RLSVHVLPERAKGAGRGDFVTTVDQSDIRGLVTGMRLIRQGLPLSTCGRRSPPCGRPKGGSRIPPTVLPSRPAPLALSLNTIIGKCVHGTVQCGLAVNSPQASPPGRSPTRSPPATGHPP